MEDGEPIGTPESDISWRVDVSADIDSKRAALACHASQTSDVGMMLQMPPEIFAQWFGTEFYIEGAATENDPVVVYALLDGPSVSGAYRFACKRTTGVVMDVEVAIFMRKIVH